MNSNWRWIALVIFILLSLSALYFHDVLTGKYLLIERDLSVYFIPPRFLWVELVKNGAFPLWNPYYLNGTPLFAALQPGVLYPLSFIFFILPFDLAFNYTIALHFFLAGLFTFFLLRCLGASHGASLISAVTFMLSGYLLSIHSFLNNLLSVAWVPLVFALLLLGLRKGSLKFIVFSGLAACTMFLGGGIEIVYVTLAVICLLTLFWDVGARHAVPLPWKVRLCYLGIFIAIFVGLSAVQLLPFIELSAHSSRAGGLDYEKATMWSLHPKDLLQFFLPDLYGFRLRITKYFEEQNWLKTIYLGTIPFLLSIFFFLKKGEEIKRQKGFFTSLPLVSLSPFFLFFVLIVGSLILAFGKHTPIYFYLYEYIPFFNKIRYPVKFLFLTTIVISVTAGLGYDRLLWGIREKNLSIKRLAYGISALSLFAVFMLGCLNLFETPISNFLHHKGFDKPHYNDLPHNINNMENLLCITAIFGLVVFISLKSQPTRKFLLPAVLGLLTFDLLSANLGFYLKTPSETYHETSSNMNFILSDKSLFRIFITPETIEEPILVASPTKGRGIDITNIDLEKITTGLGIERHIFDVWGKEVMILKRTDDLDKIIITAPSPDSTNLLDLMNVKYVISISQITSDKLKMVKMNIPNMAKFKMDVSKSKKNADAFSEKQINEAIEQFYMAKVKIYQNLNCLPRAFLVKDYKVISSEEEYKDILCNKEFNPSNLLLLEENPITQIDKAPEQKKIVEKVEITRYNANSISLQVDTAEPKFLFMSESYYPGWKAYVDGKEAHIYRANYAFRALFLEPGEHKVEFIYDPWTFKLGLMISIITIGGVIFLLFRLK